MSISFSRNVRNAGLISALVMAPCLAITPGLVSAAETIKAQVTTAPNVPPPITRTAPANIVVELEAHEWVGNLSDDNKYKFWGFGAAGGTGTVPGPMIRVMVGDTVEIHLKNSKDSKESHNIDFHAVTGQVAEQQCYIPSQGRKPSWGLRLSMLDSISITSP